ncbi:MAG: retroviral-like aspartic protease family protein [Candidatus Binatia bacterium]
MKLLLGGFLVNFCLFAIGISAQEVYRWVEENGRIHFTDNFLSIPEEYRDNVEKRRFRSTDKQHLTRRSQPLSSAQKIVVPFTRHGNRIIVEGIVNGRATVKFLVDTGAELTSIPRALARPSGISLHTSIAIPIAGIAGTVVEPLVRIDSLRVGEAEVRDLEVLIMEGGPLFGQGLLGANFLSGFQVGIDYAESQLILDRIAGTGE